jgi:hypothetical protein
MKVTITKTELNKWQLSTYKTVKVVDAVFVTGAWLTEIRNKVVKWIVPDHTHVNEINGACALPAIEQLDTHFDGDVLNSEIAGYPVLFTENGVFTSKGGISQMGSSFESAMAAKGITKEDLTSRASDAPAIASTSVTQVVNDSKSLVQSNTKKQMQSLQEFYFEKYGEPKNDIEAVRLLGTAYKELIGNLSSDTQEGIAEYYRIIANRGLPAFHWMVESFHVVSKKAGDKKTFNYVVGMLRSWLKNGFGHIPSTEEDDVVRFMQEVIGCELSVEARQVVQTLLGLYGATKTSFMLNGLKDVDYSYFMALSLRDLLANKFGEINPLAKAE